MIPDCVPEYYRSISEQEEREFEKWMAREENYHADKLLMKHAKRRGKDILCGIDCADECWNCKSRSRSLQTSEEDDMGFFVCYKKTCEHKEDEYGQ